MQEKGLPSERFVNRFKIKAHEFEGGEKLLRRLEQNPAGLWFILIFLELHCGAPVVSPTQDSIKSYMARRKSLANTLDDLADRMTTLAREVDAINLEPDIIKMLAAYGERPFCLPQEIRSYAALLPILSKELRDVSLRTIPMDTLNVLAGYLRVSDNDLVRTEKAPEKYPQASRTRAALNPLIIETGHGRRTKRRTGQTNCQDLGLLLEIGYAAFGVQKTMASDAVRHLLARASDRRAKRIDSAPKAYLRSGFGRS